MAAWRSLTCARVRLLSASNMQFSLIHYSYLREYQALGTAGGIYHFRDEILRGDPKSFFVIHADIACAFPLQGMLDAHSKHRGLCTLLGTKVRRTIIILCYSL